MWFKSDEEEITRGAHNLLAMKKIKEIPLKRGKISDEHEIPKVEDIQNDYLSTAVAEKLIVTIFTIYGIKIKGKILDFDDYVIKTSFISRDGRVKGTQIIYKSAITSVGIVDEDDNYGNRIDED